MGRGWIVGEGESVVFDGGKVGFGAGETVGDAFGGKGRAGGDGADRERRQRGSVG